METETKKSTKLRLDQHDFFKDFNLRMDVIQERRTFEDILERVGKRKFGKSDLMSYDRQLRDLGDKVGSMHSKLKTFTMSLGHFKDPVTIQAMTDEIALTVQKELIEFLLIVKEMFVGKEAEGDFFPLDERRPRSK
ncbi:hypothetical protein P3G55_20125 [Leptospira sp. 96542]|nr:hypothetical protein [Leptospira sp. 96542]